VVSRGGSMNQKNSTYILFAILMLMNHCSPAHQPPPQNPLPNASILEALSGPNVLSFGINGSHCLSNSSVNIPCTSVQVCSTTGTQCITVPYLLVDTGSTGLRVFKSVVQNLISNNVIQPISPKAGTTLAECVQFGDGSTEWGPVYQAGVILGEESVVSVPIQIIDPTYATLSGACGKNPSNTDQNPNQTGFNGILGFHSSVYDCGSCLGMYYQCQGNTCKVTLPTQAQQLTNPISQLPVDNNGAILMLPSIPFGGVPAIEGGYLVLGIDTQTNNSSSQVTSYATDNYGFFSTTYQGKTISAFLDSGTNTYSFPSNINPCLNGFYCPSQLDTLDATILGTNGRKTDIEFFIGNANALFETPNKVFLELGGGLSASQFDWGLPFYIGRDIFVGIKNTTSHLGQGPYWGF